MLCKAVLAVPFRSLRGISEFMETRSAQGIVQQLGFGVFAQFIGQPVPFWGQGLYAIVIDPGESVQKTARLFLHKVGSEPAVGKRLAIPHYD